MTTNHLMTTDINDLRDTLTEAQELLDQAIRLLQIYTRETDDTEAEHYLIAPLRIHAHRDHGYLTSDLNIDDLIDRLDETEPDDDDALAAGDDSTDWVAQCTSGNMAWSTELHRYVTIPTDED